MPLRELIDRVAGERRTLTLYNVDAPDRMVEQIEAYVRPLQVRLATAETTAGLPRNFAVLHDGTEFIAASTLGALYERVDVERMDQLRDPADVSAPDVLERVDHTTFEGYDKPRMVLASRQIERWAWKYGQGELHAGFQHFSSLGEQLDTYEALSADTDLTIHVYGRPDEPVPETLDVVEHPVEECELAKRWFLVLGGAIDERATRALVAQRDTRQTWTGFWTHRTDLVEDAMDEIEAQRATLQ